MFRNPLKVKPVGKIAYFDQRSSMFSIKTLTSNPMYLIIGATALAALVLPRLLDKDAIEEMQREMQRMEQAKQQQQQGGNNNSRERISS